MPSSTVQMEDRSPIYLSRAVKRKSDDEAAAKGTSWEHELKLKVRFVDSDECCIVHCVSASRDFCACFYPCDAMLARVGITTC